eukprot:522906_1
MELYPTFLFILFWFVNCGETVNKTSFLPPDIHTRAIVYLSGRDAMNARVSRDWYDIIESTQDYGLADQIKELQQLVSSLSNPSINITLIINNITQLIETYPDIPLVLAKYLPKYFDSIIIPIRSAPSKVDSNKLSTNELQSIFIDLMKPLRLKMFANDSTVPDGAKVKPFWRRLVLYQYVMCDSDF